MDDMKIECLDEYKDLVMPGIKKGSDERAAASASSEQASSRVLNRRRPSSSSDSSGSSSLDADIFQKLFDGKFHDDELLNESSSNVNRKSRSRLSSFSSCSDDVINELYGQQSSNLKSKRRERLESYDSIDDLGDALMGSNRSPQLAKPTSSNLLQRKQHCDNSRGRVHLKSKTVGKKPLVSKAKLSVVVNKKSGGYSFLSGSRVKDSSSSSSSNFSQIVNKKRPVTIVKAPKPNLKPPVHEPKQDPLHLQDFSDETDTDSYSEFYDDDETDEDGEPKQVIDISTDTSTITSVADTVTPVVSEDEAQHNKNTPQGKKEHLQSYLNNLSSAETPPSKQKRIKRKSRSNEKKSLTPTKAQQPNEAHNKDKNTADQTHGEAKDQLDEPSSSATKRRLFDEPNNQPSADYVDINLTYEALERLSLNLEEQIMSIDTERSIEFEKRSASKPRSNSSSKLPGSLIGSSLSVSHVRKLAYSNESLDQLSPLKNQIRRVKSDNALKRGPGRPRKNRCATTEGSKISKDLPKILPLQNVPTQCKDSKPKETSPNELPKIPKKRGRPRKHFPVVIEKTENIEAMETSNELAPEKLNELNNSIPQNLNQPSYKELNIGDNRVSLENIITEMKQFEIEEKFVESATENEKNVIENNILVESVEKSLSQQENSNDSFVSAQEEIESQSAPSGPADAEDTLVEQLHVKAATEEESLTSKGAGKEHEEEPQTCDSAVDRDKELSAEKCEDETSVGQCIQSVGDNLEQKLETILKDDDLPKANTESASNDHGVNRSNLLESSTHDGDKTSETNVKSQNTFNQKEDTSIKDVNNSKEAEITIANNDNEGDKNMADDVKEICMNEPVKDIEAPNVLKELKEDSSCVKSTKSPCPSGRKSRSSKRALKSDVDALVSNEVQRRNSPRLTEKSPAAERELPAQLKGVGKTKLDKPSIDSLNMATNSKVDNEKVTKEDCLTDAQSQSSNLELEVNSTEDTQTSVTTPETEAPVADNLSGKQKSRGAKSKLNNDKPSPMQQKTVLVESKEYELPEFNKNAHLLNDPSSSKDQIISTTDNAPPSTDNYTASIPIKSEEKQEKTSESIPHLNDTSSDNPDLLTVPITCKETLSDSITYPTDNSFTSSGKESQENDECNENQLIQTNTEVLTSKDVLDLPISTTETVDIKTGVAIACDKETLNNMDLNETKMGNELGQSISEIAIPTRMKREMRGLMHDNKEIFMKHLNEDIRSTRLRSQTPNKNKCSTNLEILNNSLISKQTPGKNGTNNSDKTDMNKTVEPETETDIGRDIGIKFPNTDNLSQEVTMNINNKMETETNPTTISKCRVRKCRVRIKRIRLPIYTKIIQTFSMDKSCKTIEKTLDDALVEDMKEHNNNDHIVSAEVVKHSVEEKVEDKNVQLVDQEIDIDVKGKSEEMKDSLDSENEKKSIEEEQQFHSDITYAVKLPKEAEHEAEMCPSPSLTETTGVTTSVDNINGDIVDDSQPDEGTKHMKGLQQPMKSNKRNSKKNIMAPPAPPRKRELPSVEGALRKMAKRRKIGKRSVMESKESPLEESVGSPAVSSVIKITAGKQNQVKKSVQKQSSPMKSALSSLLTDSEPMPVDNSVIITKTAVTTPTIGSYKKQEISSPTASGINISVSVVPDANKQQAELQALLSKKPLTQAETVRKMFSLNPPVSPKSDVDAVENSAKGSSVKALPAVGTVKKTKGRKPAMNKRVSLPAKLAKSSEDLADQPIAGSDKKGVSEKIQGSEELPEVVNSEIARISLPQTQTKHLELENVPQSKSNKKKSEIAKSGKKAVVNDSTLNEETATNTSLITSSSGSREPSNERTKRSYRANKSVISKPRATTPVTRATSQSRSTAVPTTDPVSSIVPRLMDLQPKPQRQSKKNRKKSSDLEQSHSSRKRKLPVTPTAELANVKRAKEDAINADVAFPVRITAASTANVTPSQNIAPAASLELLPVTVPSDQDILKEQSLPPQPLPLKQKKLRVLLNRRTVKKWLAKRQQEADVAQQASEPPVVRSQPTPVAPVLPQRQVQRALPAAKSVPLPVPLPALEVKEEMETEQEEPPAPVAQTEQPSQPRVVDVRAVVQIQPQVFVMAPPNSNPNAQHVATSTAGTNNSSSNSNGIPSASATSDSLTFGTTKMFSFLHPSRYQRSYGQVGLDFCCPNLDGPMQAIDPTRLHAKVEVPVLELPQYMVISTKIISKQDKNIPPKVRAKLEQLSAKEGLPCAIQAIQTLSTPTAIPTVQTTAVASIAQTVEPPVDTVNDRLHNPMTSTPMQAQKPQAKVPAAPETTSLPAMTKSKSVPNMLQLPTICPTDMLRTELQSRVQLFDAVLQRIARRAAAMSDMERQAVIENIVKNGALLPIDVTVGTKLLESYVQHLDAANNTMTESVSTAAPTSTTTQVVSGKSNSLSKSSNATAVTRQVQQRVAGADVAATAGGTVPVAKAAAAASDRNPKSRPIYDKDRNIIGYQYKAPKQASDTTAQSLHTSSSRSTLGSTSGAGVGAGKKIAHHFRVLVNPPTSQNSKLATGSAVTTPARAEGVRLVTRAGSGISIPFNPSSAQKTYVKSPANSKLAVAPLPSSSSSSSNVRSTGSNSNLFIVNQVLSQPEECILPDTDGPSNPGILDAEIKGEIEDAEMC